MAVGLVLEGGGMRGWYTSGVLTALQENRIVFPVVYGISAGALNALAYISGQNTREYVASFLQFLTDERYLSVGNLQQTGSIFGFDFLFGELFHRLLPFDYKAFFNSPAELKTGVTDLRTGGSAFFGKSLLDDSLTLIRASCSLPMISNIVSFQGRDFLDGGCAMPIPAERSLLDGNEKNVIVLTRDAFYRKSTQPEFPRAVLNTKYGDYPRFVDTMLHRGETYNSELLICSRLEETGKAVVIRPSSPIMAGRYEKNVETLTGIYKMGIRDCEAKLGKVRNLLDSNA